MAVAFVTYLCKHVNALCLKFPDTGRRKGNSYLKSSDVKSESVAVSCTIDPVSYSPSIIGIIKAEAGVERWRLQSRATFNLQLGPQENERLILFHCCEEASKSIQKVRSMVEQLSKRVRFSRMTWQVGDKIWIFSAKGHVIGKLLCCNSLSGTSR